MEELKKFRKISGKQNSLITAIFYNKSKEEISNYLGKQLEQIQNIKDTYKRKLTNDLIYNFKCKIESDEETKINKIYLVSPDEINNFSLSKDNISVLKEYNKPEIYYHTDERFNISYILDLFTDFNFFKVFELDKKSLTEFKINSSKKKKLETKSISSQSELLERIDSSVNLLHGNSTFLKNLNSDILFFNKRLREEEVIEEISNIIIKEGHVKLQNLIDNISNPEYDNKIIFGGNETRQFTELSMISTLYIHENIYKKYLNRFKDFINFNVIEIKKLEHGDISDILKKDYDNCIGELYYKKSF